MKKIYGVHYVNGFTVHEIELVEDLEKAKVLQNIHQTGSLARFNLFVPIETIMTEERLLAVILHNIDAESLCMAMNWEPLGEYSSYDEFNIDFYINNRQIGWELLEEWRDKHEEEHWIYEVCKRYPTEEEKFDKWYSMMEDSGCLSAYEANLKPYDPLEDDPDIQYANWCLKNSLQKGDKEAERYSDIEHHGAYPWEVADWEDDDYRIYVMSELGLELDRYDHCKYCEIGTCKDCKFM